MNTTRFQHLIPASLVLILALAVAWTSFTQEPAAAFLFPRLISVFLVALSVWNFIRAALGMSRVGSGFTLGQLKNILPGMLVAFIFIYFAARGLGFYVSSIIAFLAIYTLYDPAPWSSARDWAKRIMVTAGFMAVIYGLFAFVLQVQTPRGIFI